MWQCPSWNTPEKYNLVSWLQVRGVQWEMLLFFSNKALPIDYNGKQLVTTSKHRNFFCLCFAQMEIWLLLLIFPSTPGVAGTSDNLALIKTSRVHLLSIPQKNSDHVGIVKSKKIYNRSCVCQLQPAGRWEQIDTAGCSHPAGACRGWPAELQPARAQPAPFPWKLCVCWGLAASSGVAKALKLLSAKLTLMRYWDLRLGLILCAGGACGDMAFSWSSSPCSPGTVLRPVPAGRERQGAGWGLGQGLLGTSGSAKPPCHPGLVLSCWGSSWMLSSASLHMYTALWVFAGTQYHCGQGVTPGLQCRWLHENN